VRHLCDSGCDLGLLIDRLWFPRSILLTTAIREPSHWTRTQAPTIGGEAVVRWRAADAERELSVRVFDADLYSRKIAAVAQAACERRRGSRSGCGSPHPKELAIPRWMKRMRVHRVSRSNHQVAPGQTFVTCTAWEEL
jgi:hypothetical protein